jgi:hypothetical protein
MDKKEPSVYCVLVKHYKQSKTHYYTAYYVGDHVLYSWNFSLLSLAAITLLQITPRVPQNRLQIRLIKHQPSKYSCICANSPPTLYTRVQFQIWIFHICKIKCFRFSFPLHFSFCSLSNHMSPLLISSHDEQHQVKDFTFSSSH